MASAPSTVVGQCRLFLALLTTTAVFLPSIVAQEETGSGCVLTCTLTTPSNEPVRCIASACAAVEPSQAQCLENMINVTIAPGNNAGLDVGTYPTSQNNDTLVMLSSSSNDSARIGFASGNCCAVVNMENTASSGASDGSCLWDVTIACVCVSSVTTPEPSSSTSAGGSSSDGEDGGISLGTIIGIAAGGGVVLILFIILVIILCRRKRRSPQSASLGKDSSLTFNNPGFLDPGNGSTLQKPVTVRPRKQGAFTSFRLRFSSLRSGDGSRSGTLRSSSPGPKDREHPVYRCERRIDDFTLEKVTDCLELDTCFRNLLIMLGYPELLDDVRELPEGKNEGDDVVTWLCLKSWRDSTLGTYSSLARALRNLRLLSPLDELKAAVDVMDDPVPAYNLPTSAGILSNTDQDKFISLVEGPDSSFVSTFQRDSRPIIHEEYSADSARGNGTGLSFVNPTAGEDDDSEQVGGAAAARSIPPANGTPPTSPWDKVHLNNQGSSDSVNTQTENPYNTVTAATATFQGTAARPGSVRLDVDRKYKLQPVVAPVAPGAGRDSRNVSPGSLNSPDGGDQQPGSAPNADEGTAASGGQQKSQESSEVTTEATDSTYAVVGDVPAATDSFQWSPERYQLEDSTDSGLQNPYASIADVQAEGAANATPADADADAGTGAPGKPTPGSHSRKGPPVQPYHGDARKGFLARVSADEDLNKRFSWSAGDDPRGSGLDPRRRSYVARNPDDDSYAYPDKSQVRASVAVFTIPRTAPEED